LPLQAGKSANYLVTTGSATWDTTGSAGSDNTRSWDLSGTLTGDDEMPILLSSPSGAWWASEFPDATYATVLSHAQPDVLGVFHVDDTGVTLLGVVSQTAGSYDLTYDTPAQILKLPFGAGSSWSSTSYVHGTLDSLPNTFHYEQYEATVDQVGTMK